MWANIVAQLRAANMGLGNLAKLTPILSDRRYAAENRAIRLDVLLDRQVAVSVIITGIFDEAWPLEIGGIAAA